MLWRVILSPREREVNQLLLSKKQRSTVLYHLHNEMGHIGVDSVFAFARDCYFWPHMYMDVKKYITLECNCLISKKPNWTERPPIVRILTTLPFELISIYFLHLEKVKSGYEYILMVIEYYTRFAQVYLIRNKAGKTVSDKVCNDFIMKFGIPVRLQHDQGREFENSFFYELQKLCGIARSKATPYHPQGNGQVEWFHRNLLQMMRTLSLDWRKHVNKIVHAYTSNHYTTGFSPIFFLFFGRHPVLPVDRELRKNIKVKSLTLRMSLSGRNVWRKHIKLPLKNLVRVQTMANLIIFPKIRFIGHQCWCWPST